MAEVTLAELESKFEKKLAAIEAEKNALATKLDEFNKSATKAAIDAKDVEITNLKNQLAEVTKNELAAKSLVTAKDESTKAIEAKVTELTASLAAKTSELEKVTKELGEIRTKEVLAGRLKAYRDKSGDVTSKDEDLSKKFTAFSDESFASMLEFVKKVEAKPETPEEVQAKALAAVDAAKKTNPDPTPAPTGSEAPKDSLRATAAKMVAELFKEEKK